VFDLLFLNSVKSWKKFWDAVNKLFFSNSFDSLPHSNDDLMDNSRITQLFSFLKRWIEHSFLYQTACFSLNYFLLWAHSVKSEMGLSSVLLEWRNGEKDYSFVGLEPRAFFYLSTYPKPVRIEWTSNFSLVMGIAHCDTSIFSLLIIWLICKNLLYRVFGHLFSLCK
jgi:hypothetical protein